VIWIEKSESTGNAYLCGAPTDVGLIMSNDVYETYESVFFVSATLAIHGDFSFIQQRLGAFESNTLSLDSPFDFESRVSLYIPDDLPLPQDRGFVDAAVERTASLIEMTDGNCLILFTSYEMLKDFSVRLRSMTKVPLYVQGELDPARAVSEYVDNPGGVLLGTHSFWQGLDLPGNLLKCVIITKLPFPVPDRPDVEARCEILESKGVNAFTGYHLPSAVIQFKQGFGRLMRRSDDAGVVAVFDGRIRTKGYGRHFIESLPKCRISDSVRDLSRFIERTFVF
jgi:ATP-dependent DNA helicase DinG